MVNVPRTVPTGEAVVTRPVAGVKLKPAMGGVPAIILGPGETAMAHKTDEYCLISKIEAAVGVYADIARKWTGA